MDNLPVPYRLSDAATDDLGEIDAHIAAQNPSAVDAVLDDIEAICQLLGEHPGVGRHRDELGPGVMSFPAGAYVIFYQEGEAGRVDILRILHGRRDIPTAFG